MPKNSHFKYRFPLPLVHNFIERINEDGKNFGIQTAMKNVVSKSGSKLVVKGLTKEVKSILKGKKVLIVANHPYGMDPIPLIGTLPERNDLFLIISYRFLELLPNLKHHLIPVYVNHQPTGSRFQKVLDKVVDFFYPYHYPLQSYQDEKVRIWNKESIKKAASKVKKGGLVILFTERNRNSWRNGVGYLLKEIGNSKDTFVVKAFVKGTSHFDYARLIPRVGKFLPTLVVTFSPPIKIDEILHDDPKKITSTLEKDFRNTFRA